jgi:hypothetical protein
MAVGPGRSNMDQDSTMREIRIKIVDFGDVSTVIAKLDLQAAGYEVDIVSGKKLIPSDTMEKVPEGVELTDFPPDDGTNYMVEDPAAWGWLVGSWIVLRVGENAFDDAYDAVKKAIADIRKKFPKAEISVSGAGEESKPAKSPAKKVAKKAAKSPAKKAAKKKAG